MTIDSAFNAYMADRLDRHGHTQATRNEAYERFAELEKITQAVAVMCKSLGLTDDQPFDVSVMLAETRRDDEDERGLILAMVEAEMGS